MLIGVVHVDVDVLLLITGVIEFEDAVILLVPLQVYLMLLLIRECEVELCTMQLS